MSSSADDTRRLEREIKRLRHELEVAVETLPHLREMVQHSGDGLILAGPGGVILEANARVAQWLAVSPEQLYGQPLGRWLINPAEAQVLEQRLAAQEGGTDWRMELDLQAPLQRVRIELEAHCLQPKMGQAPRWTLSLRDLGERRLLQSSEAARQVQEVLIRSLRSSEARYRELVARLTEGMAQLDAGAALLFVNPALEKMLALPEGALLGRRFLDFLPPVDAAGFEQLWGAVLVGQTRQLTVSLVAADAQQRVVELTLRPRQELLAQPAGGAVAIVMARDITRQEAARSELTRLVHQDALTGLANAEGCRRELDHLLDQRFGQALVVVWLDLDGFRRINHGYGRQIGDALLRAVAQRLRSRVVPWDLLGRLAADEFLVVSKLQVGSAEAEPFDAQVQAVVQELRQCLSVLEIPELGRSLVIEFCAGVSLAPEHGTDAEALLLASATALGRARESGVSALGVYDQVLSSELRTDLDLELRLSQVLAAQPSLTCDLQMLFQPQLNRAGALVGAEALLLWHDPHYGVVLPERFVPLAERSGLIYALGRWVLQRACFQLRLWLDQGLQPPRLAVNVSPRQFDSAAPRLLDQVQVLLRRYSVPPALLELEITESCVLPAAGVEAQINQLAALGLHLSLDDFGTGYSSLTVLHRLAIHKLKIDRSFIRDLETSDASRTIVRTALAMGRGLGLQTVAEGVETAGQRAVLEQLGCDLYQGYWFHRPLQAEAFAALLPRAAAGEDGSEAAPPHAR